MSGIKPQGKPREWLRFTFPRQDGRRKLCLSDFFRSKQSGEFDVLGVQLVTVGDRATEMAEALRKENRYQDYLYLHGFGVESAEALAEFWHKRMRQELGFATEDDPSIKRLFQQKYRGSRYSFGYPACPNLEDRALLAQLLEPEAIGVSSPRTSCSSPSSPPTPSWPTTRRRSISTCKPSLPSTAEFPSPGHLRFFRRVAYPFCRRPGPIVRCTGRPQGRGLARGPHL